MAPEARDVEFVSGTMMYLRREVLQRIFETCKDLPFEKGDDTPLGFHLDAQWGTCARTCYRQCGAGHALSFRVAIAGPWKG